MLSLFSQLQILSSIRSTYTVTLLLLLTLTNSTYSTPIVLKQPSPILESRAMIFRVAAYTDIMNHVLKSKMDALASTSAAAAAATAYPVLQEMSLSEKSTKVAVVIGLIVALLAVVVIAGLVTAATLSVLAFNKIYLRVIADSGTEKEKEYAKMVLELRKRPYNIICAFVFTGSAMAELIPLLVSLIMQEVSQGTVSGNLNAISIVIAVVLVIVFVELLPLGYTVRRALFVNKFLIRFAQALLWIWYPITFPIDWTLGKIYELSAKSNLYKGRQPRFSNTEERFFGNTELTRFVELHVKPSDDQSEDEGGEVHKAVVEILRGAFRLQNLTAKGVMHGWRDFRNGSEVFNMESKVNRQMGLGLFGYGVDGAVLMEAEDPTSPQCGKDIDMVPLNGKKVRGFIHWSNFISNISEDETRAKFLSREVMPIVYDCFTDLLELFSLLHHGSCKMALVVVTPPAMNEKGRANIPPCSDYAVSKTKIFWSNQPHIFAYVKPIGVIAYQSLLKTLLKYISQSAFKMPDPMDRFKPVRWNTQEKLAEIDKMYEEIAAKEEAAKKEAAEKEATEKAAQGTATGVFDKILSFGTRRRKGTIVEGESPVGSSRGSIFEALGEDGINNENEKEGKH
ncbi:hypothetical protein TWF281_002600 [Arthrobotrys megalospora]